MYLITPNAPIDVNYNKSSGSLRMVLQPWVTYVVPLYQQVHMTKGPTAAAVERVSQFECRVPNFVADTRPGPKGSLLFYAGAGGYGDQFMAIPVIRLLALLGYQVTVLIDPGNTHCYSNLDFIHAQLSLPLAYDTFRTFKHYAIFETITNVDEHAGQLHPVDTMLNRIGIDPRTIAPAAKICAPVLTPEEIEEGRKFIGERPVALYQLAGSGENRRLHPAASRRMFMALAERVPELDWVAIYDQCMPSEYFAPLPPDAPPNARLHTFPTLRPLFAVASLATVGVSIDSLLVHLMGSFGRPCIGLWGPLHPELRAAYYPRATAIWHRHACPLSPCLRYKPSLERCPVEAQKAGSCLSLLSVEPDEVAMAVRAALAVS